MTMLAGLISLWIRFLEWKSRIGDIRNRLKTLENLNHLKGNPPDQGMVEEAEVVVPELVEVVAEEGDEHVVVAGVLAEEEQLRVVYG